MFLKIMGKNKNKHRKVTLFGRSKLNSIEKIISKALLYSNISHEELPLVNYLRLKKNIMTKDNQLGDIEMNISIKYDKRVGIDQILKQNDRQSLKCNYKV